MIYLKTEMKEMPKSCEKCLETVKNKRLNGRNKEIVKQEYERFRNYNTVNPFNLEPVASSTERNDKCKGVSQRMD
jgi:hypothetical protein